MAKKPSNPNPEPHPENLTPWKPGQSGNPSGRPKDKPWADAFRKFGAMTIDKLAIAATDTTIEACVKKYYQAMLKDPQSRLMEKAADRTEGRVPLPLIGSSDEPIQIQFINNVPRPDRHLHKPKPKGKHIN